MLKYSAAIAGILLCLYTNARAAGWDPVAGTYYELSPYYTTMTYLTLADTRPMTLTGFRIHEHNGPLGMLLLTLTTPADTGTEHAGVERDNGGESDLLFLFNPLGGDAGGFAWNFYLGAFAFSPTAALKSGVKFGIVSGTYQNSLSAEGKWSDFMVAIPLRYSHTLWAHRLDVLVDLDLNLLSAFQLKVGQQAALGHDLAFGHSPLRLEVRYSPHQRFLVYGGLAASLAEETKVGFGAGYFFGAGLRF
jgi:hypothetical protein